jgi:hypothetical protein
MSSSSRAAWGCTTPGRGCMTRRSGRFMSQDRFKDKYPSMSPYQYAALNPVLFIDVNGDSVDVSHLNEYTRNWLIGHLTRITGVQLEVNARGMLVGKEGAEVNENGTSKQARDDLMSALGDKTIVTIIPRPYRSDLASRFLPAYNQIFLNLDQILYHELNSEGIPSLSTGIGMVFLHELLHSPIGLNKGSYTTHLRPTDVDTDPIMMRENLYRDQIGRHMGQRESYYYITRVGGVLLDRPYFSYDRGKVYGRYPGGPYPYTERMHTLRR